MDRLIERLGDTPALEGPAASLAAVAESTGLAAVARGARHRLGHPLHPALTDLPIGFWTSAWALDIVGGPGGADAARTLIGLGVATALPTIASGLGDVAGLGPVKRRVAVLHGLANLAATGCYAASWTARRPGGDRGRGVRLGWMGAAIATAGGALGGFLALGDEPDSAS